MSERHILNLGAGVQSTALYLMAMSGEMHPIECAIFADTGEEPGGVYKHLEWLQSLNGPKILVRTAGRLGEHLVNGTNSSVRIFQYFGISWDERSRASRIWERFHLEKSTYAEPVFPLVDRQWTRANCIDYLAGKVPHETPRSACVFCPFHNDAEWQRIKDHDPAGWARAVEIDTALRTPGSVVNRDMEQTMYLHRSCLPLVQIEFRPRENVKQLQLGLAMDSDAYRDAAGFGVECEGVCGV